jgi:hypothetical protein
MSELIQARRHTAVRKQFLATASALALVAYIAAIDAAKAEDARPTVWVELGGQLELLQGTTSPFTAPFMSVTPTPEPYQHVNLIDTQHPSNHAFGLEGRISFQPEESDWVFSAAIRYGRSHTKRHLHHQTAVPPLVFYYTLFSSPGHQTKYFDDQPFADSRLQSNESHTVLDFQAGRDVGLGILGHGGTSTINAGVRFAQFSTKSTVDITGRPAVNVAYVPFYSGLISLPVGSFHQYTMHAHAERSFHGVGPSLSWNASAELLGNDHAQLTVDWGVNAALLFGRQKAKTDHTTAAYYLTGHNVRGAQAYIHPYPTRPNHSTRSRSVVVPNLGGFAGLSLKYPNAKISLGYRADFFFGAVDAGIDVRRTKDLGFHGPFATISIGLGG